VGDKEPRYPGTCRDRFATLADAERASGRAAGVRLRVPAGALTIDDAVFGATTFDVASEVGDFLIARRGGAPAYQLAVVVDDAAGGVTEVVRGADLLPSAARQWHVQAALGLPHPRYAHLALVTDEHGARLAKHADALSLAELRDGKTDPRAVVRWAARTLGMPCDELATARELVPRFRLTERAAREEIAGPALVAALAASGNR
jgi:glutamyl-tRNA synthetase